MAALILYFSLTKTGEIGRCQEPWRVTISHLVRGLFSSLFLHMNHSLCSHRSTQCGLKFQNRLNIRRSSEWDKKKEDIQGGSMRRRYGFPISSLATLMIPFVVTESIFSDFLVEKVQRTSITSCGRHLHTTHFVSASRKKSLLCER